MMIVEGGMVEEEKREKEGGKPVILDPEVERWIEDFKQSGKNAEEMVTAAAASIVKSLQDLGNGHFGGFPSWELTDEMLHDMRTDSLQTAKLASQHLTFQQQQKKHRKSPSPIKSEL